MAEREALRELRAVREVRDGLRSRTADAAIAARNAGIPILRIANELGMTRPAIYKLVKWREANPPQK